MKARQLMRITLVMAIPLLASCSVFSTWKQNIIGQKLEAYYSSQAKVVCFTTSSAQQENVYCLPAKDVDLTNLTPEKWTIL